MSGIWKIRHYECFEKVSFSSSTIVVWMRYTLRAMDGVFGYLWADSSGVACCYAYKPYIYEFIRAMHEWVWKCGASDESDKKKRHHENRKKTFFTQKNEELFFVPKETTARWYQKRYPLSHFLDCWIISWGEKGSATQKELNQAYK